jgi:hypothetical protein
MDVFLFVYGFQITDVMFKVVQEILSATSGSRSVGDESGGTEECHRMIENTTKSVGIIWAFVDGPFTPERDQSNR